MVDQYATLTAADAATLDRALSAYFDRLQSEMSIVKRFGGPVDWHSLELQQLWMVREKLGETHNFADLLKGDG